MSTDNSFFHHKGVKVAKGDEVVITLRGEVSWVGSDHVLSLDRHHVLNPAHHSFQCVRVIPKPIKVGDTVRTKSLLGFQGQRRHLDRGVVVAIDNYSQQAWVKPVTYGLASQALCETPKNETWNVSELELVP